MHVYYHVFGLTLASYGTFIALGVLLANLIAARLMKKAGDDYNDLLLMEAYALLGAMIGAKLLYLLISWKEIRWDLLADATYFHALLSQGFVFYGGLIGGLVLALLAGRFHRFDSVSLLRKYVFLIPFAHAFGRIGCFFAGCCYGIPYEGPGAVIFPESSFAPAGVSLFPIQLTESAGLFVISLILAYFSLKKRSRYTTEIYLIVYGIFRFFLEFLRSDDIRGHFGVLSTSQWISLLLILFALFSAARKKQTTA